MYPIAGVSVLLTIVSFVLVMLTIFAGNKPGFMEDYHILYVSSFHVTFPGSDPFLTLTVV